MFAYCGNNPISKLDSTGEFWLTATICGIAVWKICVAVIAVVGALAITNAAAKSISTSSSRAYPSVIDRRVSIRTREKEEEKAISNSSQGTVIYRYGKSNPGNLTPKQKDSATGLSFSTVPPQPGIPAVVTTIEAVNATGVLLAIQDSPSHVSVIPAAATMQDWIDAGTDSIWTNVLKGIVIRWG